MFFKKWLGLLALLCLLPSCTHLNEKINKLSYHQSKSKVLDALGRPFKVQRKKGLDLWIYKIKKKDKEYTRTLVFKDGFLLKVKRLKPYPDPHNLLEEAENLDQYKKAIKHIRRNKTSSKSRPF